MLSPPSSRRHHRSSEYALTLMFLMNVIENPSNDSLENDVVCVKSPPVFDRIVIAC